MTAVKSGSRSLRKGVGTQIVTTDAAETSAGLLEATYFLALIAAAILAVFFIRHLKTAFQQGRLLERGGGSLSRVEEPTRFWIFYSLRTLAGGLSVYFVFFLIRELLRLCS